MAARSPGSTRPASAHASRPPCLAGSAPGRPRRPRAAVPTVLRWPVRDAGDDHHGVFDVRFDLLGRPATGAPSSAQARATGRCSTSVGRIGISSPACDARLTMRSGSSPAVESSATGVARRTCPVVSASAHRRSSRSTPPRRHGASGRCRTPSRGDPGRDEDAAAPGHALRRRRGTGELHGHDRRRLGSPSGTAARHAATVRQKSRGRSGRPGRRRGRRVMASVERTAHGSRARCTSPAAPGRSARARCASLGCSRLRRLDA